jgi:hypothetical protein
MPDIRKVENSLIGNPKVEIPKVELDGRNQCNEGNKHKIDYRNNLGSTVIAQFLKFYI